MTPPQPQQPHWLVRATTRRWLWRGGIAVLAATVVAQFAVHLHASFGLDALFGFYALYGFLSCVLMVGVAKLLGVLLKRADDYYDGDD